MAAPALPEGWRVVRLGDVCDTPRYGANAPARPFDPALPRYVRITDITDEGRLRTDDVRSAEPEKVQGHELHPGDLLFARSGSVGRTYLYRPEDGPCVYAGYLIRFRPDPTTALPRFVDLYTHSPSYYRWVDSVLHVGAQPNVNAAEYSSLPILLPPLPEQRAIIAVLDSIDEAIERTEEVVAAAERLRDALLHELLTRGLPGQHTTWRDVPGLGTIPSSWEVVRLGDVCEVISGYAMGPQRAPQDHPRPYLTVANVHTDRVTVGELRYMELTDAEYASRSLRAGDLVVVEGHAQLSQLGRAAVVPPDAEGFAFQNHLFRVRLLSQGDLRFVCASMNGPRGRAYFASFGGTTSGLNTVSARNLRLLPLAWPGDTEQRAIAATLDSVDAAIERAREERAALQSSKASTADALLTGRVRVDSGGESTTACR